MDVFVSVGMCVCGLSEHVLGVWFGTYLTTLHIRTLPSPLLTLHTPCNE